MPCQMHIYVNKILILLKQQVSIVSYLDCHIALVVTQLS